MKFPNGSHDDQVDVLSLFGRMLGDMVGGCAPSFEEERKRDRWDRAFDEDNDAFNWKVA